MDIFSLLCLNIWPTRTRLSTGAREKDIQSEDEDIKYLLSIEVICEIGRV